jgi:2'-5' RNA ligase
MSHSAFIVDVPEAEPYVADLRIQFDPSARLGTPAHVTVLYPFMPPESLDDDVLRRVAEALSGIPAFDFRLEDIKRFPGVLYLEAVPPSPFTRLTNTITGLFPAYPPYGGQHREIVPHLTVAQETESILDTIEREIRVIVPIDGFSAHCSRVLLIENASGRWRPFQSFGLLGRRG